VSRLEVDPVTPDRWSDLVELFERRGPRGGHRNVPAYGCWCMYWRDRTLSHGEPKKRAMEKLVRSGAEPGLLAYDGGEPVGWVSVGPRDEFRALLASPQYRPRDDDVGVWSIVCFAVDRYAQNRGVATALLDAAVDHACTRGASQIEAYPHVSNRSDYMGFLEMFLGRRFRPLREKSTRTIVRRGC
jgi:ribosomal protein S18 acetylase RimI-like enzyme